MNGEFMPDRYISRPELKEKTGLNVSIVDSNMMRAQAVASAFLLSDLNPNVTIVPFDRFHPEAEVKRITTELTGHGSDVDFVYVGGEYPLVYGLTSNLTDRGVLSHGPSQQDARLEGNKLHFKRNAYNLGLPTAVHAGFNDFDYQKIEAKAHAEVLFELGHAAVVIKDADMSDGKANIVVSSPQEARRVIDAMYDGSYSNPGNYLLIEQYSVGIERSLTDSISDGVIQHWPTVMDYRQAKDGDEGLMTAGVGITGPFEEPRNTSDIRKILSKGHENYRGRAYIGMKGQDLLKWKVRDGNPEILYHVPQMRSDFLRHSLAVANGTLDESSRMEWSYDARVVVVGSTQGYPVATTKGETITGIDEAREVSDDLIIYTAMLEIPGQPLLSTGWREFAISAKAENHADANELCLRAIEKIRIGGKPPQFRTDIGIYTDRE